MLILADYGDLGVRNVKDHIYSHWSLLSGDCVVNVWVQTAVAEPTSHGTLMEDSEYEIFQTHTKKNSYIYTKCCALYLYHTLAKVASAHLVNCTDYVAIIITFFAFLCLMISLFDPNYIKKKSKKAYNPNGEYITV